MESQELSINDLMVGDWVYIKEYPLDYEIKQVKPEHFVRSLCWFKAIPLTPEILKKNGLSKNGVDLALFDRNGGQDYVCGAKLDYVHELQHAYYNCGFKKQVVL